MKKMTTIFASTILLLVLSAGIATAGNVKSAGVFGVWSAPATWVGGVVPGPTDIVTIADGDTVTYDMLWTANNTIAGLIVGEGTSGVLQFSKVDSTKLTINGDLLITKGAIFKAQTKGQAVVNVFGNQHLIIITGNLTYLGKLFETRIGSAGSTLSVVNFEFAGSTNSTITMTPDTSIVNTNFEFNGITINKSGTARVTLNSDLFMTTGSSSAPYHSAVIRFLRGKVYTGNYTLITMTSTNANLVGASDSCYVIGAMSRANASGGATREWYVGDTKGYRPIKIRMTNGIATGHWVTVRAIEGNANTGSSAFTGTIDKVTSGRYYKVDYFKGSTTVDSLKIDKFYLGYGAGDGIKDSTLNLRIAYSTNSRATWNGVGQVGVIDTAIFAKNVPRYYTADSLVAASQLKMMNGTGPSLYLAFARKSGTTDNSLDIPFSAVGQPSSTIPERFVLEQNYPNPFNPSTTIRYELPMNSNVSLNVYDVLGKEVATLVNGNTEAGVHTVQFNAANLSSGIYFYTLRAGSVVENKKMLLIK